MKLTQTELEDICYEASYSRDDAYNIMIRKLIKAAYEKGVHDSFKACHNSLFSDSYPAKTIIGNKIKDLL